MRTRLALSLCSIVTASYLGLATLSCGLQDDGLRVRAVTPSLAADALFAPLLYVCNDTRYGWVCRGWLELWKEPEVSRYRLWKTG